MSEMKAEKLSRYMNSNVNFGQHRSLTEESLIAISAISQMTTLRDQYRSVYGPLPFPEEEQSMKLAANYLFEQTKIQLAAVKIQRAFRRFFRLKYGYDLHEVNPLEIDEGFDYSRGDFVDRMTADGERRLVTTMANLEDQDEGIPSFEAVLRAPPPLAAKGSKTPRTSYQGASPAKEKARVKRGWVGGASANKIPSRPPSEGGGGAAGSKFSTTGPRYGPPSKNPLPLSRLKAEGPALASGSMASLGSHPEGRRPEEDDLRDETAGRTDSHLVQRRLQGNHVLSRGVGSRSMGEAAIHKLRYKDPVLQHRLDLYRHHTRWLSRWEERQMQKQVKVINRIEEMQTR